MSTREIAPSEVRSAILDRLEERRQAMVEETVDRIWTEIPAYRAQPRSPLADDVTEHIAQHYETLVGVMKAGRHPVHEDLLFTRAHTAARVGHIPLADFMQAFRIFLAVMWRELLEEANDEASSQAVLALVDSMIDYVNFGTTHAAELYGEIEQLGLMGGERVRRDLLEDLVAGRPIVPGPRQDAAREAGLGPDRLCLVIVALPRGSSLDEQLLRSAASALARGAATPRMPIVVPRRDEIVIVAAVADDASGAVDGVIGAQQRLARQGVRLAVGISTVQPGLGGVAAAYREARGAADSPGPAGGVLALPKLSALDYLISFRDPTAQRLVRPEIGRFVAEDLERGGVLAGTLVAYFESDLNVTATSKRLHIHTNTAHHRLGKIAERTQLDLRKLDDVLELVVAIRLARPLGDRPPGAWA